MFNKLDHFRTAGAQGAKPPLVESQHDEIPNDFDTHWPSHLCQETGGHEGETQLEFGSRWVEEVPGVGKHAHHPGLTALSSAASSLLAALFTGEGVAVLRNNLGLFSS